MIFHHVHIFLITCLLCPAKFYFIKLQQIFFSLNLSHTFYYEDLKLSLTPSKYSSLLFIFQEEQIFGYIFISHPLRKFSACFLVDSLESLFPNELHSLTKLESALVLILKRNFSDLLFLISVFISSFVSLLLTPKLSPCKQYFL